MSEGVGASADQPRAHGRIRNPQDFYGGLVLVGVALFALWASSDLPGMKGFAFGPGTAPRLFAGLLLVLSACVAILGLLVEGPKVQRFGIRGLLFMIASLLFFGVTIRDLGLVVSSYITIVISAAGTRDIRWIETLIWAAVLTLFCALLFPYALNLPLQLWPRF